MLEVVERLQLVDVFKGSGSLVGCDHRQSQRAIEMRSSDLGVVHQRQRIERDAHTTGTECELGVTLARWRCETVDVEREELRTVRCASTGRTSGERD